MPGGFCAITIQLSDFRSCRLRTSPKRLRHQIVSSWDRWASATGECLCLGWEATQSQHRRLLRNLLWQISPVMMHWSKHFVVWVVRKIRSEFYNSHKCFEELVNSNRSSIKIIFIIILYSNKNVKSFIFESLQLQIKQILKLHYPARPKINVFQYLHPAIN